MGSSRSYLFLLLVVALAVGAGIAFKFREFQWGLDIRGGVRLVYSMPTDPESLKGRTLDEVRTQEQQILERRARGQLGVAEPFIVPKGENQFIVELPGYSNIDEAERVIGSTGKLQVLDATTVVNEIDNYRPFTSQEDPDPSKHTVYLIRKSDNKKLGPGDPEYLAEIQKWPEIVSGDDLASASPNPNGNSTYNIGLKFSSAGANKMETWTRANNHKGERLAAFMDGIIINIPPLKDNAVISTDGEIEGQYSADYAKSVCDLLNSGALPVQLTIQSRNKVDPSIGQNALDKIVTAGVVAFAVISAFMLVYYVFPGVVAFLALLLYILFSLTVLKWAGATFSLAAIAGFVLSVGMAVDANILVFERVKEELRSGRGLHAAIEIGFRRALPAIVDSNACTVLTALVLANLGTGPVKGFATTLIIGVLISLFTAVSVTRSLLVFLVDSILKTPDDSSIRKLFGLNRQWFGESLEKEAHKKPLQIVNKAGRYFLISGLTIVPGVIFLAMGGLKPNVEFRGGSEASYIVSAGSPSGQQIVSNLESHGFKGSNVQFGEAGNNRVVYITVPPDDRLTKLTADQAKAEIAKDAGLDPDPAKALDFTQVKPAIQKETITNAVNGVILSSILIIVYLALRFGFALGGFVIGLRFSTSAILALLHDILVVLGLAAIMGYLAGWEISALFISAMLTVIGFSTHDTIVIFDRIRENLRKPIKGENSENLINRSITQSVARSINTSMTVIVTLALLIAVGSATPELKLFNGAMLIGIISGTYSSIFNASPILYLWDRAIEKKHPQKSLLGMAAQNDVAVHVTVPTVATPTPGTPAGTGAGYGQTKRRRASDVQRSQRNLDDDV